MIASTTFIRVRYSETDQMGYVYYGNYAQYYEVGRVELLRSIGLSYKALEDGGVMMPVLEVTSKYLYPARYDDKLKIVTTIPEIPTGVRIFFTYKIYNEEGLLIHEGTTELVFVNMKNNRPCRVPNILKNGLVELDNLNKI